MTTQDLIIDTALRIIGESYNLEISHVIRMKIFKIEDRAVKSNCLRQYFILGKQKTKWMGYKKRSLRKHLGEATERDFFRVLATIRNCQCGRDSKLVALQNEFEKLASFIETQFGPVSHAP